MPPKLFQLFKHNIQLDLWDILLLGKSPPPPLSQNGPEGHTNAIFCWVSYGPSGPEKWGCMSVGVYKGIVYIYPLYIYISAGAKILISSRAFTIPDISQLRHPWRGCTFFKPVYFFHRERERDCFESKLCQPKYQVC